MSILATARGYVHDVADGEQLVIQILSVDRLAEEKEDEFQFFGDDLHGIRDDFECAIAVNFVFIVDRKEDPYAGIRLDEPVREEFVTGERNVAKVNLVVFFKISEHR